MSVISLSLGDLVLASVLVVALAATSLYLQLGQHRPLLISALRTIVQLSLVGMVLKTLFTHVEWYWVALMMVIMLSLAGYEVSARQTRRFRGWWGYGLGLSSMAISSVSVLLFGLWAVVQPTPWYQPQYAIPLLGMLLGNGMTGVALSLDRLTDSVWKRRREIEARLMLGETPRVSVDAIRKESISAGMMPIINAMSAAGLVSLPGMMTGQILGGTPPLEAVKYQILIMLLITAAAGFGSVIAVSLASKRLFDIRGRLALDRLTAVAPRQATTR